MKARDIMTASPEAVTPDEPISRADIAREVGPRDPADVVKLLEEISEPATDRTPAPTG
ncbi:MAG: hypothetical protein ACODAA_01715 [Gemmatimonadota bacterium]